MKHDADYFRARRRAAGILERGDFANNPRLVAQGRELAVMMMLPMLEWPSDLYGNTVIVEQLMADGDFKTPKIGRVPLHKLDDLCHCNCNQPHLNRVSGTKNSQHGHGFNVVWFLNQTHKDKWVKAGRP